MSAVLNEIKGRHTQERARFWGVSERTMYKMKAANPPVPIDDPGAMVKWFGAQPSATQTKLGKEFLKRIREAQAGNGADKSAEIIADPDYDAFDKAFPKPSDLTVLSSLKRLQDFALFKIDRAQRRNDFASVQDATKLLMHYSSIIHDEELRAQKLGKMSGDMLSQVEHENIISAHAFWAMRCVDATLDALSRRMLNLSSPEQARTVLEPFLLSARFFEPFVHGSLTSARNALPSWFVDRYIQAVDNYIENGGELARAQIKSPGAK